MKSWIGLKTIQIGILILGLRPLDYKKSLFDCHQHNSFRFDQIFLKLADNVNMGGISNMYKTWLDLIICLKITPPLTVEKAYI